ncbi:MAG: site-2 protease family protein [Coriobacteriales bacterium]
MSSLSSILSSVLVVVLVMVSIILHEVAHGLAAYALGDTTARDAGRLSLNPFKHLDLFGSVLLPLALALVNGPVIGYAKPVPYNPDNLRNPRSGEVIVGLAGPLANLALALAGAFLAHVATVFLSVSPTFAYWFWQVSVYFVQVNLFLMFFNLIPLPPLDGSSIIFPLLRGNGRRVYYQIERYSLPILIVVMIVVPWLFNVDPVGWYLNHTAMPLATFLVRL